MKNYRGLGNPRWQTREHSSGLQIVERTTPKMGKGWLAAWEGMDTLEALARRADELRAQARSENTSLAYSRDFEHFKEFCSFCKIEALPATPATVVLYLAAFSEVLRPGTLERRLTAISRQHRAAGLESPTRAVQVRDVLSGIKRERGTSQVQRAPLLVEDLRKICATLPDSMQGKRDRALLLVGWAGAFRRSELVSLTMADIQFVGPGVAVTVRRSKTDQEGKGHTVGIRYGQTDSCPVAALHAWIEAAKIKRGPVFRSVDRHGNVGEKALTAQSVASIVKRAVSVVGCDAEFYSGHSLRAGHVTSRAMAGESSREIRKVTGHKSDAMLERYIRDGELFRDSLAVKAGL